MAPRALLPALLADDGPPKFDLRPFDSAYFRRLRARVAAARARGLYLR